MNSRHGALRQVGCQVLEAQERAGAGRRHEPGDAVRALLQIEKDCSRTWRARVRQGPFEAQAHGLQQQANGREADAEVLLERAIAMVETW